MNVEKIVNLTPHEVVLVAGDEVVERFEPSGIVARVEQEREQVGSINYNNFPIRKNKSYFGKVINLPEQEPETMFIVSRLVADAVPQREDLIFPDEIVRDSKGRVVGCQGFGVVE